ncbi:hypothetical protein DPEC_G00103230 [Dallia pectoralis]|uniref:Uncharacterized protein n=1 Tax=Dallia pectoralis TaxID=75939 RepID=A0ACC2GX39_DALPE|nr:hypothetical protein DPEC_G00103230 [Dallia pectoralis]
MRKRVLRSYWRDTPHGCYNTASDATGLSSPRQWAVPTDAVLTQRFDPTPDRSRARFILRLILELHPFEYASKCAALKRPPLFALQSEAIGRNDNGVHYIR